VLPPSTPASSAFRFPFWPDLADLAEGGVLGFSTDGRGSVAAWWWWERRLGEMGDASGVGAVSDKDGGINCDVDGIVLSFFGGEGVRVRSGDFDFPRIEAGSAGVCTTSEGASPFDIVGILPSPVVVPEPARCDAKLVLSSNAVFGILCVYVSCNKNGDPSVGVLVGCYRIANCEITKKRMV
jgi:hypothetical protein